MRKKVAKKQQKYEKKTCVKCGKQHNLDDFYVNKEFSAGYFRDNWCKECVKAYVTDLITLKEYCFYNNREFCVSLFDKSIEDAEKNVLNSEEYNEAGIDDRNKMYWAHVMKLYLSKMNLSGNYIYANNTYNIEEHLNLVEKQIMDSAIESMRPDMEARAEEEALNAKVIYSDVWNGMYSKRQLDRLDDYYKRLTENFDISDVHMEDMYREVAKIAIERDDALDEYRKTRSSESFKTYKELCDMYIKMSDAGKLSASKRTKNDSAGFRDLGSLIKRIEETGALMRKVEFEKDDVDTVVMDFAHLLRSFDGETLERSDE